MTTRSQSAALRSPVFGGALLVLVVNDHWLKGAGLLPGWLTGKLSDFAGLIVAPVLVAVLTRARSRYSRFACWALVAGCFAAIKLFPAAARGVEHFTRWVGFGWRIWSDPTDLLALSVLPLGWRMLRSSAEPARPAQHRWWLERVVGIAAMLACVATSRDFYVMQTSVAIINMTHEDVKLQVFRPSSALDCDAVVADPEPRSPPTISRSNPAARWCHSSRGRSTSTGGRTGTGNRARFRQTRSESVMPYC